MRKCLLLSALMVSMSLLPIITASDGDGDGVDDEFDICPFASGTANSTAGMGCPDSDGDGLANFEQAVMHDWSESKSIDIDSTMGGEKTSVTWAQNNSVFFASSKDNEVSMYDKSGNFLSLIYTMQGQVHDIGISPNGDNLIVASNNGGCKIINATNGVMVADLWQGRTNNGVFEVAWSNDDSRVFCGGFDAILSSYHTSNWSLEANYSGLPGWISGIDTTPDGRLVFVASYMEVSAFWVSNGTQYTAHTNHTDYIRELSISPDGRYVATGGHDSKVIIMDVESKSIIKELTMGVHVYDIDFSPDGGSMIVARGYNASSTIYRTDTWDSIGDLVLETNWAPGLFAVEFDADGERLALAWRRGWVSVHMISESFIRVEGKYYTSLMEDSWRSSYPTADQVVGFWESDRLLTTVELCSSGYPIGSSPNGVSPVYATKAANYSTTGLWDCLNTDGQIIEIPYGRAAGALMVKSGGTTESCMTAVGGLSMAQVRWITSGSNKNILTSNGEMPGLVWNSVVPNDDGDGIPEWSDLHSSCDSKEITLVHRWENRSDITILEETVLCSNCAQSESIYSSTLNRLRINVGEPRGNVTNGTSAPAGDGSIGFTELVYTLEHDDGLYIVPLVDNYTHGAVDAVAAGGVLVNASIEASRSGDWPLQTDMRAFTSTDQITKNHDFMKYLLSDPGQLKWEQMGFTGLSLWERYIAYAKLGEDMYYILPDNDSDGVWDGDDICPDTELGLEVNFEGCPQNELDDDSDGFTNDIDDCPDFAGNSTFGSIGCPDNDGDGWQNSDDSHPNDHTEWNDTDLDSYGDNSDDCVDEFGNSTNGLLGCIDTDGDSWADSVDDFPSDPTEWKDTDSDGFGDNIDNFPFESTQWLDSDLDGFGDNNSGLEGDDCVNVSGTSYKDGLFGCLDTDGDGWADSVDDLPSNPEQYIDADGDGVGDSISNGYFDICVETPVEEISMVNSNGCSPSERDTDYDSFTDDVDQCPETPIQKTTLVNTTLYLDNGTLNPVLGCAPSEIDADNDGYTSDVDEFDNNPEQWIDTDGDGYGDNVEASDGDDCPNQAGTSIYDKIGCSDLDGDGWSSDTDFNDMDATQWSDTDGDGYGDNWDNPDWSEGRVIGEFISSGVNEGDRCPNEYSSYLYSDTQGCISALIVEEDEEKTSSGEESEEDSNLMLIIGIAGAGIIFVLFGAIAVLVKKKPQQKRKNAPKESAVHPALEDQTEDDLMEQVQKSTEEVSKQLDSDKVVDFVSKWEDLPDGDWLPNDENGVNWYQDNDGRYWHSTDDGFRVWDE